jgi:hypothetical protein
MARGASGVWLRAVSRLGLVCRGTVYRLVGYLALRLALATDGQRRARERRRCRAGGHRAWLGTCLAGVARRRARRLRAHPADRGRVPAVTRGKRDRQVGQRAVSSWGCLLYLAFCLSTARLLAVTRPKGTAGSEQRQDTDITAALLRTGLGRLLLVLVGVFAVAAGVEVGRRSVRLDFRERFTAAHMSRALATITRALGGFGCVARAVVFVLVGFFIVKAAVLSSAKQTKGLDAVFRSVAGSAYGTWLLALLAAGLLCYGLETRGLLRSVPRRGPPAG